MQLALNLVLKVKRMTKAENLQGRVYRISGPVVGALGLHNIRLLDMVLVGEDRLIGEVIRLSGDQATIQVYEDTSGLRLGEHVENTGQPLIAHLGPGLMGQTFDGLQRPLDKLAELQGGFIQRGSLEPALSLEKIWQFSPIVKEDDHVTPGTIIGTIPETESILHRVMVPAGISGRIVEIQGGGKTILDVIARIETQEKKMQDVFLAHTWPIRTPRPFLKRLDLNDPLITGKRVIDLLFPISKGGSAIIPGGFGTGKTVLQQSLARWAAVDIVVYVGCGERGNEIAEVLAELPKIEDRRSGSTLIERTVIVANTSNMPVAAREASIYLGVTIAEYYRDMGYDVLVLADSTSRWGEALREVSSRLEEIPGEEGYPAYLASRLSEFYERAGRVSCQGSGRQVSNRECEGSISLVGAVSPPGGDFSDPITQSSMRVAGVFWALDYELSRRRHFPAINWTKSFSLVDLSPWYFENIADDYSTLVHETSAIMRREDELLQIVQLIGQDALSEMEREILVIAKIIREDLLQQSAIFGVDSFCPIEKSYWMLKVILTLHHKSHELIQQGITMDQITNLSFIQEIARMKEFEISEAVESLKEIQNKINLQCSFLQRQGEVKNA
jgi:V/A-type H+/Na+-transporting ATPase subunit A